MSEEQRKRFLARIDDPGKNRKISQADMNERGFWEDYIACCGRGPSAPCKVQKEKFLLETGTALKPRAHR